MGQVKVFGKDAASFLERMTVADTQALPKGKATLSLLMNSEGGIKDDCIITRDDDDKFFVVLNAGCKDKDLAHIREHLESSEWKGKDVNVVYGEENSLVAVQGPKAAKLLEDVLGMTLSHMDFMTSALVTYPKSSL